MATITDPIRQRTGPSPEALAQRYARIRALSEALAAPLSDADATAQSMPDASPAKWHLAHVSWFFETFVLRDHLPGYRLFDDRWPYLFNSYYEAEGPRHARPQRGLLTRPSLEEVLAYRAAVDAAMLDAMPMLAERCGELIGLGLNHEQQHQELLLTDLKHLFACNPLGPAVWPAAPTLRSCADEPTPVRWREGPSGLVEIGDRGEGFAFDNERPVHKVHLPPFALADRLVTNGDWLRFIAEGGYATAGLWLSDGWAWVQREGVASPLHWRRADRGGWEQFSLSGWQPLDIAAPVAHISFYEADAFASWAGARLPTEQEWEAVARVQDPAGGVQLDAAGPVAPQVEALGEESPPLFGNVWQWTGSAYRPYPRFRAAPGAVGEYNGKFMSGQFVLKGGSCATPRGHVRASYRNFFYPQQRWQFTGLRLAKDL
ncbi:ergothioneine biosynthesis protein EgtB [Sphingomonas histidinilytica]|uniref:ergothioneine biosynthesis protein EgtB n=1 Tax=Rhizorhabdus histidinilytica TaxID=439228 RepID=UPI001AD98BB1|nr:ergothioneine biosynthesis protein EgtB [Rhizorhabdus histidinilytica]MBO9378659.1 ergothioneine biosynthesis protein EgtB [Rhizorhabdus histidinilytica]